MTRPAIIALALYSAWVSGHCWSSESPASSLPSVEVIYSAVRQTLPEIQPPRAGETNAEAYLNSLAPDVLAAEGPLSRGPSITKTNVYSPDVGYLRIARVDAGLPLALTNALNALSNSNVTSGLVLDLRYAGGWDFDAAAEAASYFSGSGPVDLRLGEKRLPIVSRAPTNPLPVMVLVNRRTRGAAEGLAAAVRTVSAPSAVLGNNTAGQARAYRDVVLPGGGVVRVSSDALTLPAGQPMPRTGLVPDILVEVPEADEALYFADEYHRVVEGRRLNGASSLRMNEAELVRRRRGLRSSAVPADQAVSNPVQDPVLARGIDLLSAVASVRSSDLSRDSR